MDVKKLFYLASLLFFFIFAVRLTTGLSTHDVAITELLLWGTMIYLCLAAGQLYPTFKKKDERVDFIKTKGMKISLYVVLFLLVLTSILNVTNMIQINMEELFKIAISITIISLYTSWLILVRKY